MKVLVTGATGFVGSHLSRRLLHESCDVHAIIHPGHARHTIDDLAGRMHLIEGDLTDTASWADQVRVIRPEICFHLAWITTPGLYLNDAQNLKLVSATLDLARTLAESGCRRLVAVGTCFEYDTSVGVLSEDTPAKPVTLYAACKHSLSVMLDQYCRVAGMSFAWARLFYLYGPWEHPKRLVPTLIRSCLAGVPAELSSGDKVRDYLHVEDTASAIWSAASSGLNGVVNVGSGKSVTIREIAEIIGKLTGRRDPAKFDAIADNPDDPRQVVSDNRRLRGTGWVPRYTLEEGLKQTIEWWKSQANGSRAS